MPHTDAKTRLAAPRCPFARIRARRFASASDGDPSRGIGRRPALPVGAAATFSDIVGLLILLVLVGALFWGAA